MDIAEAMKSISFRYYNKYPGFEGDEFEMLDNKVRHNFDVHGTFVFVSFELSPGVVLRRVAVSLFQTVARQKLSCCHGYHHCFIHFLIATCIFLHLTRFNTSSSMQLYLYLDSKLQMEQVVKRCNLWCPAHSYHLYTHIRICSFSWRVCQRQHCSMFMSISSKNIYLIVLTQYHC